VSAIDLQAELEARREQVARLEQERADLRIEIDAFRLDYLARVGPAQADLEALELHIAEYRLRNELIRLRGDTLDAYKLEAEVNWELRGRREQFAGYQESIHQAESAGHAAAPELDSAALRDLKTLYRELAKRAHPDLALDEADRAARGAWMADINAAYARTDLVALRELSARLIGSGLDRAWDDARRLRTEIERLEGVIVEMRAEIAEMNRSDWLAMKLDAALARSRGADWFAQTRRQIEVRAAGRRAELEALIAEFRELVSQAGLG
jgi:hypothetical protein